MRKAKVYVDGIKAGILLEEEQGKRYIFEYDAEYSGDAVALTIPLTKKAHHFDCFPAFFEGLLPEGLQLEGLLRTLKIDRNDLFSQLIAVGKDTVGNVTVEEMP